MHTNLTGLTLYNFRSFAHKSLSFASPLVLITGKNGAGKTSVLEATGYGCLGRPFSGSKPEQMIRGGESEAFIQLRLQLHDQGEITTSIGWNKLGEKSIKINNKTERTHKELAALLCPMAITQEDALLIVGSPERRRLFLNQNQFALHSSWPGIWSNYKRALAQRNALLGTGMPDKKTLEGWTRLLVSLGSEIQAWREDFLNTLMPIVYQKLQFLKIQKPVTLSYSPKICLRTASIEAVLGDAQLQSKERMMGHTLFGPHLDDFHISIDSLDCKHHASRGEAKLLLIALKAAALELCQQKGIGSNLLLIDDLITDLDPQNLAQALELIVSLHCPVLMTSPTKGLLELCSKTFQHIEL